MPRYPRATNSVDGKPRISLQVEFRLGLDDIVNCMIYIINEEVDAYSDKIDWTNLPKNKLDWIKSIKKHLRYYNLGKIHDVDDFVIIESERLAKTYFPELLS